VKRDWKNRIAAMIFSGGLVLGGSRAMADTPAAPPATTAPTAAAPTTAPVKQPPKPTDVASPKTDKTGAIEKGFAAKHEAFLKRGKEGKIGLLFLGDSITEGWGRAKKVWEKSYGTDDVANFGIGGDRTEHVLWRIDNGELDGISPKVVVLMIGTNNIGAPKEQILAGVTKVVSEIHEKLPDTKLLLLGIFPRGADPADAKVATMREKIAFVNEHLSKLDDGKKTRYLDIGPKFLDPDGKLPKEIMPDYLHPNEKGYQIWADSMQPLLDEMMK
jgi:lysophospholipase L1-like esterase